MPGLHIALREIAAAEGVELAMGRPMPWLSGRGHHNELVQRESPPALVAVLAGIHHSLGGLDEVLAAKRAGNPPTPDLVHVATGCLVEVDEVQHFTTAREATLLRYPSGLRVGFDVDEYLALIEQWRPKADAAYAHRVSSDFPHAGGRQAQRAYNDALRDVLAPTFTGHPVIRVAVPGRSMDGVLNRLLQGIEELA
jgi:hypothetical protein